MRVLIFFFLFLSLDNLYANTMYMQLVEEDSEILKIGFNGFEQLDENTTFKAFTYDDFVNVVSNSTENSGIIEFLEQKKGTLVNPLIVTNDNGEAFLLDKSLNYVVTGKGERVSYLSFQDANVENVLSKSVQDSIKFIFESDLQKNISNNCTEFLFSQDSQQNKRVEKITNFLEVVSTMKCEDKLDNGMSLGSFVTDRLSSEIFKGCLQCLGNTFETEKLRKYVKNYLFNPEEGQGCHNEIARKVLSHIPQNEKRDLVEDFVDELSDRLDLIHYDHEEQTVSIMDVGLINGLAFSLKYVMDYGEKGLSESTVDFFTKDTNALDDNSRREPSDAAASMLSQLSLAHYGENKVIRNDLARTIIKEKLNPDRSKNQTVRVVQLSDEGKTDLGEAGVLVSCPEDFAKAYTIDKDSGEKVFVEGVLKPAFVPAIDGLTIPYSQAVKLKKNQQELFVVCDEVESRVVFDKVLNEDQVLNLKKLEEFQFKFGEDGAIDAVSTIGLVKEMDFKLATGMKFAFGMKGYKLVSEREVSGVKDHFLEDLQTTDLYMPINHSMSLSSFDIGTEDGVEFVFEKKNSDGKIIRLKVYTPPYDVSEEEIVSRNETEATSDEIIQSLAKRKDEHNNLMVLNLSCNAEKTIPQWMHAYTGAVEVNVEKEILAPVVISSERSFETGDASEIMEHMEYPFGVLELASKESKIGDVMSFLNADPDAKVVAKRSFAPVSNVGSTYIESQSQAMRGTIIRSDGTEEKF